MTAEFCSQDKSCHAQLDHKQVLPGSGSKQIVFAKSVATGNIEFGSIAIYGESELSTLATIGDPGLRG